MKITDDIIYVGVNDHKVDLFEGQFKVPEGMAYNSYLIADEKVAVMDGVDGAFSGEWLTNIESALGGRRPDFLVVQHMEGDHSASIAEFMRKYPNAVAVSSAMAFTMMGNLFGTDFDGRRLVVKEGSELPLGRHTLRFIGAPGVHWPEVLFTYDAADKVLFSADGFGKFGALDCAEEEWDCEARRYYFGIVGKFGANVQAALKKAAGLEIKKICPLHGPVLSEDLGHYLSLYDTWSSYKAETDGALVAYASAYGNTRRAAEYCAKRLEEEGCPKVELLDLARDDFFEAVEGAFRYSRLILASATYNGEAFPFMQHFISALSERNFQKRKVGLIENGSWNPAAAKAMRSQLGGCKELDFAGSVVTLKAAFKDSDREKVDALVREMLS